MSESLQKLKTLLEKLFRADAADLDFGIYRVLNHRRDQIQHFIETELPEIVTTALDGNADVESSRQEIEDLAQQVRQNLGDGVLDADGNVIDDTYRETPLVQQYLEARERHGSPPSRDQREDVVYNHLYTFFSRYYENGDFIPRRRYSRTERYAVPYNGEEVYLHWANRDQYYVKSGEHFSTYRFTSQGISITFDLRDIDVERDNVQGDKRFFVPLSDGVSYTPETDAVSIPFEYRPLTDAEKKRYSGQKQQEKIIDAAEADIMKQLTKHYAALSALEQRIGDVTTLRKHLETYTRRNTADFFVHKDLKGFLTRELDVYIKNEVMPLSDLIFNNKLTEVSQSNASNLPENQGGQIYLQRCLISS